MANVRVRSTKEKASSSKTTYNRMSDIVTEDAKSGATAKESAKEKSDQNKAAKEFGVSKPKTVKIDSNPVKPGSTTVSPLAKKRGPSKLASFGGGMGGMFSPKNK